MSIIRQFRSQATICWKNPHTGDGEPENAGGGSENTEAQEKPDSDKSEEKSDVGNGSQPQNTSEEEKKFTQKEVDAFMAKTRSEEKRRAEQADAKKKGEFEKLYTETSSELETTKTELESTRKERDTLAASVNKSIDSEIKEWPDSVKGLDPGKDKLTERVSWVEKARALAKDIQASKGAPNPEHGRQNGAPVKAKDLVIARGSRYAVPGRDQKGK